MEKSIGMPPAIHSFLSWQKWQYSAPFSLRGKEKAAGGKKKTAKGELRRNKLHIPHPVRRLRRTGVVRSVVPPFPTRIASLDSRGSPVPFANPLKTTKKGAAAPFLGFSPEFGLCGDRLRLAKRATDASLIDRRGSRNTLRLFPLQLERQFVCARCAAQPL